MTFASVAFFLQIHKIVGTSMEDVTERTQAAPLWRDFMGVVHACRSEDLNGAFLTILTLCDRLVPPNAKYVPEPQADVTCALCNIRQGKAQRRVA